MFELPVDPPIINNEIKDYTERFDFLDEIKEIVRNQTIFSAQGQCKFLIFNIKDHLVNQDRWNETVAKDPQQFQFIKSSYEDLIFWKWVGCPRRNIPQRKYSQIRNNHVALEN